MVYLGLPLRLMTVDWIISMLGLINFGVYLVCAKWYKPNSSHGSAKDSDDVNASHDEERAGDAEIS